MRIKGSYLCISALVLLMFLATVVVAGQEPVKKPDNSNANTARQVSPEGLEKDLPSDPQPDPSTSPAKRLSPPPAPADNAGIDDSIKAEYQQALRAYYDYHRSGLEHRKSVFAWQLLSSKIIFVVVIVLVLSGVYFSGVQFHSSLRATRAAPVKQAADKSNISDGTTAKDSSEARAVDYPTTHLEASLQGIKVTSPILGVIILALSFLFFYLYLKYVYPINEIF